MLPNVQKKLNLIIVLMAAAVLVSGFAVTAWAVKPDKPPKPPPGGSGGSVGTGTIYYAYEGSLWSMNPDGTGKTLMTEPGGAASIARHPAEDVEYRWFLQVRGVPGFYPITTFPPEYWNYEWREGDLEAVSTGDPDPDGAWTIHYTIMIDDIGGEADTFSWHVHSPFADPTPRDPGVPITEGEHLLIDGSGVVLTIKFGSTTGHNLDDWWEIYVRKTQRSELFAVREDGQIEVQLTDGPNVQIWSPNGYLRPGLSWATDYGVVDGKVSYLAQRWDIEEGVVVEGSEGLYAVEIEWIDGTPYATTVPTKLPVTLPMGPYDWSPDGEQIVYSSADGIRVADADGEWPSYLLCEGWSPRWSPALDDVGSTLIAFEAGSWGEGEIRTISPGGGSLTTVVTVGKNRNIRGDLMHWSPMGTHLVYTLVHSKACSACQYNDSYDVYRVGADGSDSTNLTKGLQENAFSVGWRD